MLDSVDIAGLLPPHRRIPDLIRKGRLGIPGESRESFGILMREQVPERSLGVGLQQMVGFRNLAVNRYQDLNLDIVEAVIRKNLNDLLDFAKVARGHLS